jgi:hypothetical protein
MKVVIELDPQTAEVYKKWVRLQGEPFASQRLPRIFKRALELDGASGPLGLLQNAGKSVFFSFLENTANAAKKECLKQIPRKE